VTSRELARPEDKPLSLVIGPTASQKDEIEYRNNEVARLQEEVAGLQEEVVRLQEEVEDLTRRLAQTEPLVEEVEALTRRLAQTEALETFRDLLSLDCPRELTRKTTILECTAYRERRECIKRNCIPRTMLLAKINL